MISPRPLALLGVATAAGLAMLLRHDYHLVAQDISNPRYVPLPSFQGGPIMPTPVPGSDDSGVARTVAQALTVVEGCHLAADTACGAGGVTAAGASLQADADAIGPLAVDTCGRDALDGVRAAITALHGDGGTPDDYRLLSATGALTQAQFACMTGSLGG